MEPKLEAPLSRKYDTLDELAQDFKPGQIVRFLISDTTQGGLAVILGYVYGLPLVVGGRDEPCLIIRDYQFGHTGHIYPNEVTEVT